MSIVESSNLSELLACKLSAASNSLLDHCPSLFNLDSAPFQTSNDSRTQNLPGNPCRLVSSTDCVRLRPRVHLLSPGFTNLEGSIGVFTSRTSERVRLDIVVRID